MTPEAIQAEWLDAMVKRHSHDGLGDQGLRYVLQQALYATATMPGATSGPLLEIGTYKGNTAVALLELLDQSFHDGTPPMLFTVDPHGGKTYKGGDVDTPLMYTDDLYVFSKQNLARFQNHAHFRMTGLEFLKRVVGTPYWQAGVQKQLDGFSFVFLDGDHDFATVREELHWLRKYCMAPGGRIVIDNVDKDRALMSHLVASGAELGPPADVGSRQALVVC